MMLFVNLLKDRGKMNGILGLSRGEASEGPHGAVASPENIFFLFYKLIILKFYIIYYLLIF